MSDCPDNLDHVFAFAIASPDLGSTGAAIMRYVAASTECTVDDFMDAAERAGYARNSARNRYNEAKRWCAEQDAL